MNFFILSIIGFFIFFNIIKADNPISDPPLSSYEVVLSWSELNFAFSTSDEREIKINGSEFIPKNNIFTGIQIYSNKIFLVIPRIKKGVPATLVYVNHDLTKVTPNNPAEQQTTSPLLIPYPNWSAQTLGDCNAFQDVRGIEKDQFNRLWIVDAGYDHPSPKCPPKLIIMDLLKDIIVMSYEFPSAVVSPSKNLLSDIVVGCPDVTNSEECWAYISDSIGAKLVIFHLRNNQSWAVKHSSMNANSSAENITILGHTYNLKTNINALALSPFDSGFDKLYYSPLSSTNIYSITTKTLKMAGTGGNLQELRDEDIKLIGTKYSESDGMTMDSTGLLFYGLLGNNGISYWNSSYKYLNYKIDEVLLVQNDIDLQWVNGFGFDNNGYIYATTNRMHRFISNSIDLTDVNFRIVRIYVGTKSYQYSGNEILTSIQLAKSNLPNSGYKIQLSFTIFPVFLILLLELIN